MRPDGDKPSPAPREGERTAGPRPELGLLDAIALIVGIVVGTGIFRTPSLVAANVGSETLLLLLWLLGGGISFIGALCYAELATAYPHVGGDYYFLARAFGKDLAFLFAWARMMVIQTGSIALLAFVFGDYASQLFWLGQSSSGIYAALMVLLLSGLNLLGLQLGKSAQNLLTTLEVVGVLLVVGAGLVLVTPAAPEAPVGQSPGAVPSGSCGLAMIFVLLTYGGWNEAAYISAEIRGTRRTLLWALLGGVGVISSIYVLANWAYVRGLGLAGMAASDAVAAELMRRAIGERGAQVISVIILLSALTSANASIITGARSNYALGRDFPFFAALGRWHSRANTPTTALLVQGAIALALVLLGLVTRTGFETMVEYTAPVFWFFFLLTGVALIVLRWREPGIDRPFRVPLFPLPPLIFCATSAYLLYSSLAYTGIGAFVGVAVVGVGFLLLLPARRARVLQKVNAERGDVPCEDEYTR
ncbi:MAG: amino acid permease [Thermodesulfobacteriota bacterium]